jgi:hypothetical protein
MQFQIQGSDDQKLGNIYIYIFFGSKIAIYLSPGLPKIRPSYRRSRTYSASKHENSSLFLFLWVIFALLGPDRATQINADPDPQPCRAESIVDPDPTDPELLARSDPE